MTINDATQETTLSTSSSSATQVTPIWIAVLGVVAGLGAIPASIVTAKTLEKPQATPTSAVSFAGAWTTKRSHCADREDVNRLEIDRQKLLFWESTCRIASSRAALAEQTIETKCTGEGEKWQETFTLRMDGDKMILRSSRDEFRSSTTYVHCR
ncbi:hypothetical protein [Methylocystis suflitae]|uniref:hypothetical protein n=1 Tax=Methylocystis suflitae TaxID=2951405 RepID=UPI00210DE8AC|nr:hypothetical protein [Methylocystis suflitae]MCQ4188607.1 hypothetical protein [Methylocystis suflitae]